MFQVGGEIRAQSGTQCHGENEEDHRHHHVHGGSLTLALVFALTSAGPNVQILFFTFLLLHPPDSSATFYTLRTIYIETRNVLIQETLPSLQIRMLQEMPIEM